MGRDPQPDEVDSVHWTGVVGPGVDALGDTILVVRGLTPELWSLESGRLIRVLDDSADLFDGVHLNEPGARNVGQQLAHHILQDRGLSLPSTPPIEIDTGLSPPPIVALDTIHASKSRPDYSVVFIGGGPAGTGPLVSALQAGMLPRLLNQGIAVIEAGDTLVRGALGDYNLNSDTLSNAFLEVLDHDPDGVLAGLASEPETLALKEYSGRSVPLPIAGAFLEQMGRYLHQAISRSSRSDVRMGTKVTSITRLEHGHFRVDATCGNQTLSFTAEKVVLATGGHQNFCQTIAQQIAGEPYLRDVEPCNIALTDEIVRAQTNGRWQSLLHSSLDSGRRECESTLPKVVIVGSSHSAFSVAWTLLRPEFGFPFQPGDIQILYRSRPKVYFGSADEAKAAGYLDFDDNDFCPLTHRLYRLAGMRFDGRELLMKVLGLNELPPEPRVQLHALESVETQLPDMLRNAALVVPAFGYRPNPIPIRDHVGHPIPLNSDFGNKRVDQQCRVLGADGQPISNLYGIGLASGFVPSGELGGEPSFRGQTNGFWLYQNGVGRLILDQILAQPTPIRLGTTECPLMAVS